MQRAEALQRIKLRAAEVVDSGDTDELAAAQTITEVVALLITSGMHERDLAAWLLEALVDNLDSSDVDFAV